MGEDYETTYEVKLREAKEYLGERWVLHPTNSIKKLETPYVPPWLSTSWLEKKIVR